jgi:asparagine N-glycosylation enzyme membrane subunit Stt3
MRIRRSDWLTALVAFVCWELGVFLMAPAAHRSLNYLLMAIGVFFALFLAFYPYIVRKRPKKSADQTQPQA